MSPSQSDRILAEISALRRDIAAVSERVAVLATSKDVAKIDTRVAVVESDHRKLLGGLGATATAAVSALIAAFSGR